MGLSGVSALEVQPFGGQAKFDFDASLVTFTAGMAKRAGAVFAGAPIAQGKWAGTGTPDSLTISRGTQINQNFFTNFDPYQGGGFCIWTPEQSSADRSDTSDSYLWRAHNTYSLGYEWDNNRYRLNIGGQITYVSATLTAGTPEYLAWGFDTVNKLDGTNYAYLSRNDTQTFGATTQPTLQAPSTSLYLGLFTTGVGSANGVLEGLTFVREIPWTGTYGTDTGAGDIVAAHAAGDDACQTIGSWGVTFCLPTNASVGALATGTGEAWSHPHNSALLTDTFCETTYASSAWGDEGTPSTGPADQAAGDKCLPWGYKWTCDAADEGITQTIACAAGADFALRVIAHCTSANDIRVRIWDETNGAQIGADFDFGASSSRTQPGVALFCFEAPTVARNGVGSDCVSISVKVLGTANTQEVFCHQVELQANLFDNPSLETFQGGNPDIPDGWANGNLDAGDSENSAGGGAVIHSGLDCAQFNTGASNEGIYQSYACTAGDFYALGAWIYGDGGRGCRWADFNTKANLQHTDGNLPGTYTTAAAWTHVVHLVRATGTPALVLYAQNAATGNRYVDDAYLLALDDVSLTATPATEANSAETSGLRVDGRDTCTQPITGLKAKSGRIRFQWTPRHDAADLVKFGETATDAIAQLYKNSNNYLYLYASAANELTIYPMVAASGTIGGTWNCTGLLVAGTTYDIEIKYTSAKIQLIVDGAVRVDLAATIDFGANIPDTAYWGSRSNGDRQPDATYAAP